MQCDLGLTALGIFTPTLLKASSRDARSRHRNVTSVSLLANSVEIPAK